MTVGTEGGGIGSEATRRNRAQSGGFDGVEGTALQGFGISSTAQGVPTAAWL